MTLIVSQVTPARVLLLTDTLAADGEGRPAGLVDKVERLPHLELALVVTGDGDLLSAWAQLLRASVSVRDVDELDEVAPAGLRELWDSLGCERRSDSPSIVYVFGWSAAAGGFRGFSYDSARGFESARCPEGPVGIRPAPAFSDYRVDSIDDWVRLAGRLRDQSVERRAAGERAALIGGDLMLTVLEPGSTSVTRVHRFDGFDVQCEALHGRRELAG